MEKTYVFGVDIGGTTVKLGLFTAEGELLKKFEIKTRTENGGENILYDIASAIKDTMKEEKIAFENVKGVGVGVPGPVLEDGTVNKCVNLGWGVIKIEEELSTLLNGILVKAGNDANVAALGEMWKGGAEGYRNVVMVTLGTGVGGGVIINGEIVKGSFGAGGEIGHIEMCEDETETCGCGKKGCLEQYASATGIARKAKEIMGKELTAKDVLDIAKENDKEAEEVVHFMAKKLGKALSIISCVMDPEIFVIGGGVSKAGEYLLNMIQDYFMQSAFHASRKAVFALAKLGNDAGIYGAAKLVL